MKQLSFLPKISLAHGGSAQKGKRKTTRPFDPKRPLHVVLKSSRARGEWSLLKPRNKVLVERVLQSVSEKCRIKIHRSANVGNHLHLVISTYSKQLALARAELAMFLRRLAGEIAQKITHASKSNPVGRFWDELVYSRIVGWGREFETVMRYLVKNIFEGAGVWNRKRDPDWELISMKCEPAG